MGACNCMSKKSDPTSEIISEKVEPPPAVSHEILEEVVPISIVIHPPQDLPQVKEQPEETVQDPNLLLSQVQSMFRSYLIRKSYHKFKSRPPVVLQVDFSVLPKGLPSAEAKAKWVSIGKFPFPEPTGRDFTLISLHEDGKHYQGEVTKGLPEGLGSAFFPDGGFYEGGWCAGNMHGTGRLITSLGDMYSGEWLNGRMTGRGKMEYSTGNTYEGEWLDDKPHGNGKETASDGFTYTGKYKNGLKSGFGKSAWTDGSYYEGDFLNDLYDGKGRYVWVDREYDGDWKESKMHGEGSFKWNDGKYYAGGYVDGIKQGYGVFSWPDGKRYEGEWFDGKQEGEGTIFNKGKKKTGIWKEGKFVEKKKNEKGES